MQAALTSHVAFVPVCYSGIFGLQAYSEITDQERTRLVQQEVKGMQHLLALASCADFHRDMLRDRQLTHPDLLQHCADGVQLPLQQQPTDLAGNSKLRRSLSRKTSSGCGSIRLMVKQLSVKQGSASLQHVDEDDKVEDQLIAVAYPSTA